MLALSARRRDRLVQDARPVRFPGPLQGDDRLVGEPEGMAPSRRPRLENDLAAEALCLREREGLARAPEVVHCDIQRVLEIGNLGYGEQIGHVLCSSAL